MNPPATNHARHLRLINRPFDRLQLDDIPSTLLIPLTARAYGDALFPAYAANDAYAADMLSQLAAGEKIDCFLSDRPSVFGVLARTQMFRRLAEAFFHRHPFAYGVNLGCGLSCYFQWLDLQTNGWVDADMPQVMELRRQLLPGGGRRHRHAELDLCVPGWWQRLGLPERDSGTPVLLICEGVLMYLTASQVEHVLSEFGQHAPPGSELLCDTLSWMAVGAAGLHPSVRHTHAQFSWGARHLRELTAPHPRLVLHGEQSIMDGYDFSTAWVCSVFRAFWGVPLYGLMHLGLRDGQSLQHRSRERLVTG